MFAWGAWKGGRPWAVLLLEAVSFAVAAIPEGLPAITTITLARRMQRMARRFTGAGAREGEAAATATGGSAGVEATVGSRLREAPPPRSGFVQRYVPQTVLPTYLVIGRDGVITYRAQGTTDDPTAEDKLRTAIDTAIAAPSGSGG